MKAYAGMEVYRLSFFDLSTRRRWVVSFMLRPLYPVGKGPWYPLDSHSGHGGEEKNSQPPLGIKPYNPDCPAHSPALYQLSYHGSYQVLSADINFIFYSSEFLYSCLYGLTCVKQKHRRSIWPSTQSQSTFPLHINLLLWLFAISLLKSWYQVEILHFPDMWDKQLISYNDFIYFTFAFHTLNKNVMISENKMFFPRFNLIKIHVLWPATSAT
jgi:hypothetical protein